MQMTNTQQVTLTATAKNRRGQPAALDGVPDWSTSDPSILTLTPAPDGATCLVVAAGGIGSANVVVSGDADLGPGQTFVIGTIAIDVTAGNASTMEVTAGTPEEQP